MQRTTARSGGPDSSGRLLPVRTLIVVASGFYLALAVSNLMLVVVPAATQGIEVPWGPALGFMWNPAELMSGFGWLGFAAVSIVAQTFSVYRQAALRWAALAVSVLAAGAMGDLGRWSGSFAGLAAVLAALIGAGPALAAILADRGGPE